VPLPRTPNPPGRIQIQALEPVIDCGRYPARRIVGDRVDVTATIFKDGHDALGAAILVTRPRAKRPREEPLVALGNDRFGGSFTVDAPGLWSFTVAAWTDRIATWQDELRRRTAGGQADLSGELAEGAVLLGRDELTVEEAVAVPAGDRFGLVESEPLEVDVDRELARFGSWYELFPRSYGGFRGVAEVLPQLADLGFDVVYLPPIHPIGVTNRKGRNNAELAAPGDVGSPWAIGSRDGGHDALNPELGTPDDFDAMVAAAKEAGLEIALDFAIQCSPDHPWLTEHPEWFHRRPDGTLKYAENPPKHYQDIYNVNFDSPRWRALWRALRDVVLHWVDRGITVFRVDNPHTKPIPFWEWLIREVRSRHPEVIFLAEAFTRPSLMTTLAKAGFAQSYTYFTWKNTKPELEEFIHEVLGWSAYYRPNMFANTPDILNAYLQDGGPPAFEARLVLAATLSPTYGIYSGFESYERVPVQPGSEEYLDSEKYELKQRQLDGPLLPLVRKLNEVRRASPALQRFDNLRWLETESDHLVAYAKDDVICVVNVDATTRREGICVVPPAPGLSSVFAVEDLLRDATFEWQTGRNYVALGPGQSHVLKVVAPV
jgi:starch synthase (maltosyl-transferring)